MRAILKRRDEIYRFRMRILSKGTRTALDWPELAPVRIPLLPKSRTAVPELTAAKGQNCGSRWVRTQSA